MTTPRVLVAALLAAAMSLFAAPASGQDGYGEFGVFGSPNGDFDEGDEIDVRFHAVNLDCSSWTVLADDTGEAPNGGPGGDDLEFEVSPDEGEYSITARCNTTPQNGAAAGQAGVTQVEPAGFIQGAGETQDTITFTVEEDDDDDGDDDGDGDGDGDGDDDKAGGLPDTGGENRGLLLMGGGLVLAGATTIAIVRRRREA